MLSIPKCIRYNRRWSILLHTTGWRCIRYMSSSIWLRLLNCSIRLLIRWWPANIRPSSPGRMKKHWQIGYCMETSASISTTQQPAPSTETASSALAFPCWSPSSLSNSYKPIRSPTTTVITRWTYAIRPGYSMKPSSRWPPPSLARASLRWWTDPAREWWAGWWILGSVRSGWWLLWGTISGKDWAERGSFEINRFRWTLLGTYMPSQGINHTSIKYTTPDIMSIHHHSLHYKPTSLHAFMLSYQIYLIIYTLTR